MSNEIDAGRIVAEIVVDIEQAKENVEEISNKLDNIGSRQIPLQFDNSALNYIQGSLEKIGITGEKAKEVLNKEFSDTSSIQQYCDRLKGLEKCLEQYKEEKQHYEALGNTDMVERSINELSKLEHMYSSVQVQLGKYLLKAEQVSNETKKITEVNTPQIANDKVINDCKIYGDTLIFINDTLKKLGITGKKAEAITEMCFQDVSGLKKYQSNLELINAKIDVAQKRYRELKRLKTNAEKQKNTSEVNKLTTEMEKQAITIKSLETQFDNTYSKIDSTVRKVAKTYQKQENSAEEAIEKQSKLNQVFANGQAKKDFIGSVNLATTSLRSLNSIVPDTVDGIGQIITQVNMAKQAMTSGASAPLAWGTAFVSGIGVVSSLVVQEIQKVQQAEDEARQKAAETATETKSARKELSDLSYEYVSLKTKLDTVNLSHSEEVEIKNNLLNLQKELIEKYGDEAKAINLVTGNLSEQREEIKKLAKEKADQYLRENKSDYNKAVQKMQENSTYSIALPKQKQIGTGGFGLISEFNVNTRNPEVDKLIKQKFPDAIKSGLLETPDQELKIRINNKEALNKLSELEDEIEALKDKGYDVQADYDLIHKSVIAASEKSKNELSDYSKIIDEYEKQKEISENGGEEKKSKTEEEIEKRKELIAVTQEHQSAMSQLSSAYRTVAEGGKLDNDTLRSLCEKYPEIAKYVHETGDVTLKNGELIKESYKSEQEAAKIATNAEINRLNELRASGEATDEQNDYFFKLRNTVSLYNNDIMDLQDTIDIYTNKMNNLSSVYKTVTEGSKLDSKTLENLIAQYPELAQYISETGDLTLDNGKKIKEAYKKEKQALIEKLEAEKKLLEVQENDADDKDEIIKRISQINAQIEIYKNSEIDNVDWSSITNEVKNLASAYQTLNEGKQLDVDTMINLIDKYPEVASAMAKEGKLGKEQADVFKDLFNAKKNDYILTQQRAIDNLQASADETKAVIKNIKSQIEAYQMLETVMGTTQISKFATDTLNKTLKEHEKEYNDILKDINKIQARIKLIKSIDINTYGKSGSGSGSDRNKALSNELKRLEHKKALGQLTSKQEYDWLVKINQRYKMNSDEKMDMEKRLYNAKKQMHADEEAANTKALQAAYKAIENKKSLGKLTSQQELKQLEQIRQKYKMTADERMELEIKIYNLKKSLKDEEISSINTLADVVTQALKKKYEEQKKIEEDRINDSIESWKTWEEKTVEAIQGQINALDELADKQESENKRQEYENKRQQTELQLAYEKDDYNRQQLQKELNRLDKEEAERLATEQREAKKKALQGQIEAVKGQSQATQERLQKELDEVGEKYDKLTDTFSLKAQAQKAIANNTQAQIVSLIKSYASDYEIAGNTVGDALYNGMKSRMDNIGAYVDGIFNKIEAYQKQVAHTANAAADRFWKAQSQAQAQKTTTPQKTSAPKTVTVQQTVQFNKPVESPVEIRRQLDRTNQALAKQISSGM